MINKYIILALMIFSANILLAQKDGYVQHQLDSMVVADSLELTNPLDIYLKTAAEHNPKLKSLFNRYLSVLERMPQVKALPDPTVMFSYYINPVETRIGPVRAGLSVNQAFPWFGQLEAQEQAVANIAKARFEAFDDERNRLFYEVRATYYNLYVLETAIRITEENIVLLETFKQLANVRLESNTGSAVDLLRVEMDLAELRNDLGFLSDSRSPINAEFHKLLNYDSIGSILVPDTLSVISIDDNLQVLLDSMLINNPELKQYDAEINALISEARVAEKMGLPSFNIGLSYSFIGKRSDVENLSGNGKDAIIFPQIGMSLPIWGNKYQSMILEKELLQTSKIQEKENTTNMLIENLEKIWRDYLDAKRRVVLYRYLSQLASQSLDILLAEYTSAGTDFEEILRMDRQLLNYDLELEKARADQNTSAAFITYLTAK